MMNWDNLRFFLAIINSQSVACAANLMGVNHSTVVRRISQLEEELCVKLFYRLPSGYELTDEGKKVANELRPLEQGLIELQRRTQNRVTTVMGDLSIAIPDSELLDLSTIFTDFALMYPDVVLNIYQSSEQVNLNQLDADIAIRFTNEPSDLLVGKPLGEIQYLPCIHKSLLDKVKGSELEDYPWISWSGTSGSEKFESWLESHSQTVKIAVKTNSAMIALSMVRAGLGVSYLPSYIIRDIEELVVLPIKPEVIKRDIWVLTHRELKLNNKIQVFMNYIAENIDKVL